MNSAAYPHITPCMSAPCGFPCRAATLKCPCKCDAFVHQECLGREALRHWNTCKSVECVCSRKLMVYPCPGCNQQISLRFATIHENPTDAIQTIIQSEHFFAVSNTITFFLSVLMTAAFVVLIALQSAPTLTLFLALGPIVRRAFSLRHFEKTLVMSLNDTFVLSESVYLLMVGLSIGMLVVLGLLNQIKCTTIVITSLITFVLSVAGSLMLLKKDIFYRAQCQTIIIESHPRE